MTTRKKVIFVIVEGPSDSDALGVALTKIFDKNQVYVHVVHGDVTSDSDTTTQNVLSKIADMVKDYRSRYRLQTKDFLQVVHLIDMDGAFIPENAILEDAACDRLIYSETEIRGKDRAAILKRNERKRGIIRRLYSCGVVCKTIPYQAYFMSSNLDHVLYNLQNLTDEEKERHALAFARKYKENIDGFKKYFSESDFSVTGGYQESWEYIQRDFHSLERHTNLGIWFQQTDLHQEAEIQ